MGGAKDKNNEMIWEGKLTNGFLTMGGRDVDTGVLDTRVKGVLTVGSPCELETLGVDHPRLDGTPIPDIAW